MNEKKQDVVRPLAFELARELKAEEIESIAGATGFITVPEWGPGQRPWERDHHH